MGLGTNEDAAVYRIPEGMAVIHTLDFFTPVVDDPYDFGQIAAANALSDIYAMGGEPMFALNVVCWPSCYMDLLERTLKGGWDKVKEAGAVVTGGHSIDDDEPKYGLSVIGYVKPHAIVRNSTARVGDVLVLTKPLGTGVINTAIKGDLCPPEVAARAVQVMKALNKEASRLMVELQTSACTDITGFGFLGHAYEMASGSGVTLVIHRNAVPIIDGAVELAQMGLIPAGTYRNKDYLKGKVALSCPEDAMTDLLFDPQTSGGLLIAMAEDKAATFVSELKEKFHIEAHIVGHVIAREDVDIKVI